ncbi:hypothetical protein SAMN05421666_2105 [Roseovarius nanhaiticus]|uniref:J domain-containing protein n=1 Tax=Roseovarius nanhaiticus TaxID=573024 RepID=A0A1N7GV01_9RHOB|nr:hypothetical protein [Roseovarius nanhaiticus]SEL31221.1 hypothetical protein SAMN05216208_3405 [Roseovarius nanhaiticus]SIS16384.1 hypothetical protein SAMN05421666_2105 [Roseovarius nanhaiticus]
MSSTDPFKALGLKRSNATEADVKAAYARLLKVTRPEDDRAAFMALRQNFDAARRIAKGSDARRAEAQAQQDEGEDPAAVDTPPAPQPPAPAAEVKWYYDPALKWNFSDSPTGILIEKTIRWMLAGGPEPRAFAAEASEALIAGGVDGAAFRADVLTFIACAADPEETRHSTPLWQPLPTDPPDWLTPEVAAVLRDDLGLLRWRPSDAWRGRDFNAVREMLQEAPDAAEALPAPADIDAMIEREETAARGDAHGSYYDRQARRWVDRSPVSRAMEDLQAAFDRNMWDMIDVVRAILNREELQALDEFQDLDARLRQHICAATGWQSEAKHPVYPAWWRPQLARLLDTHFGWSHQFGRQMWQRQQYEWLHKVLARDIRIGSDTPQFREVAAAAHVPAPQPPSKYNLWAWTFRDPRNLLIAYLGYRAAQILWRLVV